MSAKTVPIVAAILLLSGVSCKKPESASDGDAPADRRRQEIAARLARQDVASRPILWEAGSNDIPAHLTQEQKAQYAWRLKTTVGAYKTMGTQDPRWDEHAVLALTAFAQQMNGFKREVAEWEKAHALGAAALGAGCQDPFVKYVTAWFGDHIGDGRATRADFEQAAQGMRGTEYPAIRRFYAAQRAVNFIKHEVGRTNPPIVWELRIEALNYLHAAVEEPDIPAEEALNASMAFFLPLTGQRSFSHPAFDRIGPVLTTRWPDDHRTWYLVGVMEVEFAWEARGGGWASTVTEEGWKGFAKHLARAEEALERSWGIKPMAETAVKMMRVELGQGRGIQRLDLWFERAMQLDPANYEAASAKLFYLYPRWHGSEGEMLAFGRQCVNSEKWGGKVPLILWDAHYALEQERKRAGATSNYWESPAVWADVRAAFEKFFKVNDDRSWRHNYALYAYKCGQPKAFLEQVELMGPVNYPYFGGKEAFEKMLADARMRAK